MTLPSQFSLEEENFYKDIQDLLKNSSQNEKELSSFLQRYMDLLAKADLDDESLIINFTKAGLIIEASAKVYGTKVDRLWNNLEHVLMSLRSKSHGQSKNKALGGEEMEMEMDENRRRLSVNSRRRKKVGDALVSTDEFVEIENFTGLLGKNMNEGVNRSPGNLKFCEKVPNMFIKNKQRKKKIDVCLNKNVEEKDIIRLRDWVVSTECLLIKEIYTSIPEGNSTNDEKQESFGLRRQMFDVMVLNKSSTVLEDKEGLEKGIIVNVSRVESEHMDATKEDLTKNLNVETEPDNSFNVEVEPENSLKRLTIQENILPLDKDFQKENSFVNDLNISRESDLAKFPNVLDRGRKACLVDVDEVFWDAEKFQDLIPSRKLRSGRTYQTYNPPCKLCKQKEVHQGKKPGKRCMNKKRRESGLDSYFIPHVQPTIGEPEFGILPDEELTSTFKQETKIIEQLAKVNAARNINEAFHPDENPEELKNFLGFDGFEKRFERISDCHEDEIGADFEDNITDDEPNFPDNPPAVKDFELPVPVTVDSVRYRIIRTDCVPGPKDDDKVAEFEYQKLVKEGLKDHYEAKSVFAKNKELGIKISKWHEMISDKIKLSEKRGAMNMKLLANRIMAAFPSPPRGELPQMSFRELVKDKCRRDVPRYFFGCLQLTNEGNLNIKRTDPRPLATDCMVITQLRPSRKNCDLDESTARTPTKEAKTPEKSRKRNSLTRSPMTFENKSPSKTKRVKQKTENAYKRQKNFAALNNSKKISEEYDETYDETFTTEQPTEWNEYEDEIETLEEAENAKRPKKMSSLASDYFHEIDVGMSFSVDNVNESSADNFEKVKFYDNVFKLFVKNKTKKKRNGNVVRLRDWVVTTECLLVKEMYRSTREHRHQERNNGDEEEVIVINEDVLICSSGSTQGGIKKMLLKRVRENISQLSTSKGRNTINAIESHAYVKKPYPDSKRLIPMKENPIPYGFVRIDNNPGPSNAGRVQQTMRTAYKRQENFTAQSHPKKPKF